LGMTSQYYTLSYYFLNKPGPFESTPTLSNMARKQHQPLA